MFFSIAKFQQSKYPFQWKLGPFDIGTDAGWQQNISGSTVMLYKGYADSKRLESLLPLLAEQTFPTFTGNFCVLCYDSLTQQLSVKTDVWRGFPIYLHHDRITNLDRSTDQIFTNTAITIDSDLAVTKQKISFNGSIADVDSISMDYVDRVLRNKITSYLDQSPGKIRVFLSGGVDTLLVYSYLKNLQADCELVWANHVDFDDFWLANHADLQKNWGYRQIHHWTEPCVLASGAPGDEFMLRSPDTANLFLISRGTSIPELLEKYPNCLHSEYFNKPETRKIFDRHASETVTSKISWQLINNALNDYQHWHIGNTLTWTPLRDLNVLRWFLELPLEQAIGQIMDSEISRALIERNVPGLTRAISDKKNSGNYLSNLRKLLR